MSGCEKKEEQCILLGEKIRIFYDIYQSKYNFLTDSCKQTKDTIVVPIDIVIDNAIIEVFNTEDTETALLSDIPTIDNIEVNSELIGYRLSFIIDTTQSPLNEEGSYIAVFSYDQDSTQTFKIIQPFNIKTLQSLRGSCC